MKNYKSVLLALAVCAAALLCLTLCFSASDGEMLVLGVDHEAQAELIPDFFADLRSGNYDAAMEHVANYDTLGFEKESTELVELYKRSLIESYSVKVIDGNAGDDSGLRSCQIIELTCLDSRMILAAINEKTTVTVNDFLYSGNKLESDEQALSFVYDALHECLETPEKYYSTHQFTVQTEYDGQWRIVIDDALLSALQGYIDEAAAGKAVNVSGSDTASGSDTSAEGSGN